MSYFNKVMNMSINESAASAEYVGTAHAYVIGHRDARHSAADIANEADAELAAAKAENERLKEEYAAQRAAAIDNKNWFDALKSDYDKLLAEQSSTIELRKEIAILQTTIQGLVAEREEREPVYFASKNRAEAFPAVVVGTWPERNRAEFNIPLYAHPVPAVPEGWQLVPKEPTEEMISSAHAAEHCGHGDAHFIAAYKAMLAAAPQNGKEK